MKILSASILRWLPFAVCYVCLICSSENWAGRVETRATQSDKALSAIWVNSGEDKVTQHELRVSRLGQDVRNSVWNGKTISLFAGRNEVVAFNVILESSQHTVRDVRIKCSALVGPNGSTIGSRSISNADSERALFDYRDRNIELFFVRYLEIKGVSTLAYEHYDERHVPQRFRRKMLIQGRGLGGWTNRPDHNKFYPDIAVPLELHTPFEIPAGQNQSIWTDIYVPQETQPGIYEGQVTVRYGAPDEDSSPKFGETMLPIRLDVRPFTLPNSPVAKTMIYLSDDNVNRRYLGQPYPNPGTKLYQAGTRIIDRHFQLAHRHKMSLIDDYKPIHQMDEVWRPRLDGSLFTRDQGYAGVGVGVGNNVYSIGSYGSWPWKDGDRTAMWQNTNEWVDWFENRGMDKSTDHFLYLSDESDDHAEIEKWSRWVDTNPGSGRRLMTMATIPAPAATANAPSLDLVTSTMMAGISQHWRSAVRSIQARGPAHFMLYNGWRPASGCFVTEDDGVALRQLAWCQYKMGVHRWFAWESTYYNNFQGGEGQTNVFRQAHVFGSSGRVDGKLGQTGWNYNNGDGVLFYPGTDRVYPNESYDVPGPFASLRLKHWRRGIQDADYMALASRTDPSAVQRIVDRMVPRVLWELDVDDVNDPTWVRCDISWSTDPDDWENARQELAALIKD